MRISLDMWIITTKGEPIRYGAGGGKLTYLPQEILFHSSEELAKQELSKYDNPDKFQINKVSIDCEL